MKRMLAILLAVMLLASVLPATAMADSKKTIYISSTGSGTMNLRSGPGKSYAPKGYVHHGDKVSVLDHSGEWSKVKTASGKVGWIKTKYIDGTTKALGTGKKTVKISGGGSTTMRTGPGSGYASKGTVKNGATVKVLNTEDDWVKVTVSSSGKTGWIRAKYIGGSAPASGGSSSGSSSGKSSGSGGTKVYHVTASSLNVRKGAGTGYGLVGTLASGTPLKVISTSGNWAKINTFSGVSGWVSRSYIASGATARVTASSLNLRASANGKVISSLGYGARVTVTSISGNWAKVAAGSKDGYAYLSYLAF